MLLVAGQAPWWPLQLVLSMLAALLMVHDFITYYNYMHGAILSRLRLAWLFEAMAAIPELQSPVTATLAPRDIVDCLQCCLWDEDRQRLVSYHEAA